MQETSETQVRSLGQEDPLEEDMATQSSICAWRIPMEGGAWRAYSPWGHKELDMSEQPSLSLNFHYIHSIIPSAFTCSSLWMHPVAC